MPFIERTVVIVLLFLHSCEGQCPQTWTQYDDYCFVYNPDFKNWVDAEGSCRSFGAHLACPSSHQKDLNLRHFMITKGAEYTTWIDGTDQMEIGYWFWGSTLERMTYENWSPGEPNHNGSELCLAVVDYDNHWLNRPCRSHHAFVCELQAKYIMQDSAKIRPSPSDNPEGYIIQECVHEDMNRQYPYYNIHFWALSVLFMFIGISFDQSRRRFINQMEALSANWMAEDEYFDYLSDTFFQPRHLIYN